MSSVQQRQTTQSDFETRFAGMTHQEAQTKIALLPIQMVYEAREALKQVKETQLPPEDLVELVEPVGRAIGWAEALVFAFDKTTEKDVIRSLIQNGATKSSN